MIFYLIINQKGETEFASLNKMARDALYNNYYAHKPGGGYLCVDFDPTPWIAIEG